MTVSVIIPLYNKARYIQRALDSVLKQTVRDFEVLVVDDGSTDGGADVVRENIDPRIRLIRQENAGTSAARNRGIQEASAELIAFLDADDEWLPDFLNTVLNLRKKFPVAAVYGTAYAEMQLQGQLRHIKLDTNICQHVDGLLINFFQFSLRIQQPCNASSTMVRKDALLKVGGFPEGLVRLEDTDTLFRLALRYPIAYCPVAKAIYHMEADNRTDVYLYSGNYPFFKHVRAFLRETGGAIEFSKDVQKYLGYMHTKGLSRNWRTGNRAAMQEIIHDCSRINGYRFKCFCWRVAFLIPHPLGMLYWRFRWTIRNIIKRRNDPISKVRSIYRPPRDPQCTDLVL